MRMDRGFVHNFSFFYLRALRHARTRLEKKRKKTSTVTEDACNSSPLPRLQKRPASKSSQPTKI
jgi:hypothetical protein